MLRSPLQPSRPIRALAALSAFAVLAAIAAVAPAWSAETAVHMLASQTEVAQRLEEAPHGEPRLGPRSGLPVPRYASLKFDVVNGRDGPSFEHRVVWEYRRRGLPVLVIEEDLDWWKVRDPEGDEVWIHRRGIENRRMAVIAGDTAEIRRGPSTNAAIVAIAAPGVLLEVKDCRDGWLRVDGARAAGWLPAAAVWGAGCGS